MTQKPQTEPTAGVLAASLLTLSDLLTIENLHPHLTRHLRKAAETVLQLSPDVQPAGINDLPFGPETRHVLMQLQATGLESTARQLGITIPLSTVQLLRLPGVGPKTAYALVLQWHVASIDTLASALKAGQLEKLPGFGPARLHRLKRDTSVLLERQRNLPIARSWPAAQALATEILTWPGVVKTAVTGPARRLDGMVPSIDIVAAAENLAAIRDWILKAGGSWASGVCTFRSAVPGESIPLRVHICTPVEFPLRLMETTGDETHIGVIKAMLKEKGITWSTDGLTDSSGRPVSVKSEADIYALLDLPGFPPELRLGRGILQQPAELVTMQDIKGDLHVHSNWSDGSLSIAEVVEQAEQRGYTYVAITDHSQSLTIAHGLTPEALRRQRVEIEAARSRTHIHILHGIEVDILADGRLDLPDETLLELDLVVASVHSAMHQSKAQMTKRLSNAAAHPAVDILGHPTGRIIGRRAAYAVDLDAVFQAAAANGTAVELNANANRLDLSDDLLRAAVASGLFVAIDTDAHHSGEFDYMPYGVRMATRGWLKPNNVLNALSFHKLQKRLHCNRFH